MSFLGQQLLTTYTYKSPRGHEPARAMAWWDEEDGSTDNDLSHGTLRQTATKAWR